MERFVKTLTMGLVLTLGAAESAEAEEFHLVLQRMHEGRSCTSGQLSLSGKVIAYTLERPEAGNINDISHIPAGRYKGFIHYDHKDLWRIELRDLPADYPGKREKVQIHIGNKTKDSKGCILVGRKVDQSICTLSESAAAYDNLRRAFYGTPDPVGTPDSDVILTVIDAQP